VNAFAPQALIALFTSADGIAALITLVVLEVVLGVDNLIFISLLANRLPEASRARTRTIGLVGALVLRLLLLSTLSVLTQLTAPVVTVERFDFSWRDLILIAGGLFLVWKATTEIHEAVTPDDHDPAEPRPPKRSLGAASAIAQILFIDMVFSFDSILTAVGMTDHLPIMMAAVVVSVALMMVASGPLGAFVRNNPSVVMLALGFLLVVGFTLIADGFGVHVPKGYIYAAMAFSALVEALNMAARRKTRKDGRGADEQTE
jgi:predicted tellurium resistance membrane protein TerC